MMITLYEMTDAYQRIRDLAETEGDEVADWATSLADIAEAMETKVGNMAHLVREWRAESGVYADEAKRISARQQAIDARIKRLEWMMQTAMQELGVDKVGNGTLTVRLQNSPPSVEVVDESIIPSTFKRAKLDMSLSDLPEGLEYLAEVSVNRRAVLDALKDGAEVQGTRVVQNQHIRLY
jgi:hypothetical protein